MTLHALEWIAEHGRYLRQIGASNLRRKLGRPKGTCTWCGGPVGNGRRRWCSDTCIDAFMERCDPTTISRLIQERDRGICALCGIDAKEAARLARSISHHVSVSGGCLLAHRYRDKLKAMLPPYPSGTGGWYASRSKQEAWHRIRRNACRCIGCLAVERYCSGVSPWQADHIVPVSEGGGLCGLDGYRTLCTACHQKETASLAGRRKALKRVTA